MSFQRKLFYVGLLLLLLPVPALAASDFDISVLIGNPGEVWSNLDSETQALITFITGVGLLAAIVASILSYEAHDVRGASGEAIDVQGSRNTALSGMLRTTLQFLAMLFFIGLLGIVFKLYG